MNRANSRPLQSAAGRASILSVILLGMVFLTVGAAEAQTRTPKDSGNSFFWDSDGLNVSFKDGELVALRNGKPVPEDQIIRNDRHIFILDNGGKAAYQLLFDKDGRMVWSGNLNPAATFDVGRSSLWIGITMGTVSRALAAQLDLEEDQVILVNEVEKDSPADRGGLRPYDIITGVQGDPARGWDSLRKVMDSMNEGDDLRLQVLRGGKTLSLTMKPEKRDSNSWTADGNWTYVVPRDNSFMVFPESGTEATFKYEAGAFPSRLNVSEEWLDDLETRLQRIEKLLDRLETRKRD